MDRSEKLLGFFDQEEQGQPCGHSHGGPYLADTGYAGQHAFVHCAPISGHLTEEKINLVIIWVKGVCNGMRCYKLGLCRQKKHKTLNSYVKVLHAYREKRESERQFKILK